MSDSVPLKVCLRSLIKRSHIFRGFLVDQTVTEWNISAKTADVLEEFQSFHPDLVATIA